MPLVSTRGLVLRRVDWSETSQIVTVDTRDRGIVDLLAKGSRRAARRSSSFAEPLDLAGWYDIVYRTRTGDLHLATEARLVEGFRHLRTELPAWIEACFALEVLRTAFTPGDPHPELLRGTLSYLKLLGVGRGRTALRCRFVMDVLLASGVAPRYERCALCRKPLGSGGSHWHAPAALHCDECRGTGDRPFPEAARRVLLDLAGQPWGNLPAADLPPVALGEVWQRLREGLVHHLERPPRSLRYLRA